MAFYVGQKVVCVHGYPGRLDKGKTYTVTKLGKLDTGERGLDVDGIPTSPGFEVNWRLTRFRPVVERETDISIFRAMLNPSDKRVDA